MTNNFFFVYYRYEFCEFADKTFLADIFLVYLCASCKNVDSSSVCTGLKNKSKKKKKQTFFFNMSNISRSCPFKILVWFWSTKFAL